MLPFKELDCLVLEQIQKEALEYIGSHDLLFDGFWNKIDSKDFLKHNTTVFKYCYDLGYVIDEVALLVADQPGTAPTIHIDEPPLVAKFNFPICNTAGTVTQWYDIPQEVVNKLPTIKSPFGANVPNFEGLDPYPVCGEVDMHKPVVFNSSIPHAVITSSETCYPRIVLACMSNNQPLEFLRPFLV